MARSQVAYRNIYTVGALAPSSLLNGDFEQVDDLDVTLAEHWTRGWKYVAESAGTALLDSVHPFSGMRDLGMVASGASGASPDWTSDPLPVAPGEIWKFNCRLRSNVATTAGFRYIVHFGDTEDFAPAGLDIVTTFVVANGAVTVLYKFMTTQYAITGQIAVPAGKSWMRVALQNYHPNTASTMYVDRVTAQFVSVVPVGDVLYDTGMVPSTTETQHSPPQAILDNDASYRLTVQLQDNVGLIGASSVDFTTAWTPPWNPVPVVDASAYFTSGPVRLTWERNLLSQNTASLDDDAAAWTNEVNATLSRSTATVPGSTPASLVIQATAGGDARAVHGVGYVVKPGQAYSFVAKFRAVTVARSVSVGVQWLDASGAQISLTAGSALADVTTGWVKPFLLNQVAPANAVYARTRLLVTAPGAGEQHLVSDIGAFASAVLPLAYSVHDDDFMSYRVYRRVYGSEEWTLLDELLEIQPTYLYEDWLAGSNTSYEYAVVQVAMRFGAAVESSYTPTKVTPVGEDYWLINESDGSFNTRLWIVTGDSLTDEFEKETLLLIGRGRRPEYGTYFGYKGTLSGELKDNAYYTARAQLKQLEAIQQVQRSLYLRNPFGDVWKVAAGDISIDRIPGVGQREFGTYSIPYEQVT